MPVAAPPPPSKVTAFVLQLGHALGAPDDVDAIARVATIAGTDSLTLMHAMTAGTLATLPARCVRAILSAAKLMPSVRSQVTIDDLAPYDVSPLKIVLDALRA